MDTKSTATLHKPSPPGKTGCTQNLTVTGLNFVQKEYDREKQRGIDSRLSSAVCFRTRMEEIS